MRVALTIGYEHNSAKPQFLFGPETPLSAQIDFIKSLKLETHPQFQRVELWESDGGVTKYRKFAKPEPEQKAKKAK